MSIIKKISSRSKKTILIINKLSKQQLALDGNDVVLFNSLFYTFVVQIRIVL
jgi:hypothetical protein